MVKKICNMCGKEFDTFDTQENFNIHKGIGYGSKHDGGFLYLDLCCDCMDKIIEMCKIDPVTEPEQLFF